MARSFREPHHLPKRRNDGDLAPPEELPRQRAGITPQMHGRYPDWDVLSQQDHWDELTRQTIRERVDEVPPIRFFTPAEALTLRAFCDVLMAQDSEPRIPVLEMVDDKLYHGRLDGYQHADMPDDRITWKRVARGLDESAQRREAESFATAELETQRAIVQAFADGEPDGEVWAELPPSKAWSVVTRAILSEFYSHPWAWNEIGFGGPAYPRGYARMGIGQRETWEQPEAFEVDPVEDVTEREGA